MEGILIENINYSKNIFSSELSYIFSSYFLRKKRSLKLVVGVSSLNGFKTSSLIQYEENYIYYKINEIVVL